MAFQRCCGKELACQCRKHKRHGFDPWVGKIPWKREWQLSPVFLPGESHGQWILGGLESMGSQRVRHDCVTKSAIHSYMYYIIYNLFSSVQSLRRVRLCYPMDCSMPGLPVHHQLPELAQTHVHWVGDAIQPSQPLSSPSPPAFNLFQHQVFSNESAVCVKWPKYWSFSFNISPSNKHPGLISFRMDWLDLLAVQGTLKSLFQHYSSNTSILLCSVFFIVQLSNFPNNLYWRDYPFYIEYPWFPCQILVDCKCRGLFLGFSILFH